MCFNSLDSKLSNIAQSPFYNQIKSYSHFFSSWNGLYFKATFKYWNIATRVMRFFSMSIFLHLSGLLTIEVLKGPCLPVCHWKCRKAKSDHSIICFHYIRSDFDHFKYTQFLHFPWIHFYGNLKIYLDNLLQRLSKFPFECHITQCINISFIQLYLCEIDFMNLLFFCDIKRNRWKRSEF